MAKSPAKRRDSERRAVTPGTLAEVALRYLNRRDASQKKLGQYLERWVVRSGEPADPAAARPLIAALLARYAASGLLDDARLAENTRRGLRARGRSARAISFKLAQHGVDEVTIQAAMSGESRGSEFEAALALVRKRKLGALRPEAERAPNRRRDLGILARAGFDFDTARRALGVGAGDDEEF